MPWPTPTDFRHAIQDPPTALADEELRGGEVARNARGLPMLWSGNFASVYRIHCPATGKTWALKCFTREVSTRQERYRQIAACLKAARLPFTCPSSIWNGASTSTANGSRRSRWSGSRGRP